MGGARQDYAKRLELILASTMNHQYDYEYMFMTTPFSKLLFVLV